MTRAEHIAWAKARALAYCEAGQLHEAFGSIVSDLNKHPETHGHARIDLGVRQRLQGLLTTQDDMRAYLEGFH